MPLFDERFVNRGLNKAQQQFAMFAQGYKHVVMPGMFVVDTPMPAVQVGARGVKRLSAEAGFLKFDWKYLDKLWPTFLRQTLTKTVLQKSLLSSTQLTLRMITTSHQLSWQSTPISQLKLQ